MDSDSWTPQYGQKNSTESPPLPAASTVFSCCRHSTGPRKVSVFVTKHHQIKTQPSSAKAVLPSTHLTALLQNRELPVPYDHHCPTITEGDSDLWRWFYVERRTLQISLRILKGNDPALQWGVNPMRSPQEEGREADKRRPRDQGGQPGSDILQLLEARTEVW